MLLEDRARAISRPRQVELDRAKLELRLDRVFLDLFQRRAQADLLGHVQHAIHRATFVAGGDLQSLARPDPVEALRARCGHDCGINGDDDRRSASGAGVGGSLQRITLLLKCRFQFAQREAKHRRIGRRDGDFGGLQRCGAGQQRGR